MPTQSPSLSVLRLPVCPLKKTMAAHLRRKRDVEIMAMTDRSGIIESHPTLSSFLHPQHHVTFVLCLKQTSTIRFFPVSHSFPVPLFLFSLFSHLFTLYSFSHLFTLYTLHSSASIGFNGIHIYLYITHKHYMHFVPPLPAPSPSYAQLG